MAFSDYSTTPALNITINGIDVDEGCAPGNLNGAIRQIMADAKTYANAASDGSLYLTKSGGTMTGTILRSGAGAHLYHAASGLSGGAVHVQAAASPLPSSPAEGTIVFIY
jgi:hypothetical protein